VGNCESGHDVTGLFDRIESYGERIAVIEDNGEMHTYTDLAADSDEIFHSVPVRSLIFILAGNFYQSLCCYVGAMRNRVVPLMLEANTNKTVIERLSERYHPAFIFGSVADMTQLDFVDNQNAQAYRGLSKTRYHRENIPLHPDLALLMTTSGSTGSPQLVRISYANLDSNTKAISTSLGITQKDRPITTLPMNYSYGLSILNTHLHIGATVLLTQYSLFEKEFWELFDLHKATTFGGVPLTYRILDRIRFFDKDHPSLRYITQAGSKLAYNLNMAVSTHCQRLGIGFFVMYGQTEATARIACLPANQSIPKCGSVGVAIPGGEIWLEDECGSIIRNPMETGELYYKGKNTALGYAQDLSDLLKGDESAGVLKTGDIAYRDADGFYYIVGRKNRFVKVHGKRVSLDDLEQILGDRGFSCACVGEDDLIVVYTEDVGVLEELLEFITAVTKLPPYVFNAIEIEKLPRAQSGKIIYIELGSHDGKYE